ncbi:hypothetical protein BCO37747_06647 [Burkholderia contaminans]|jgi:hypothetical protein|uniref:Uncharacterized protein n=1 Tax=Burkholderia aenigmatica TaxID=2015348 RepID=A0A6J5JFG4_9BURK|nr:hypothetical protein BLA3211_05975 [Burkholderia aenigmatica]VWD55827.1 hypothetical protein BCO37747_06647 [Burkholderia contaminans]
MEKAFVYNCLVGMKVAALLLVAGVWPEGPSSWGVRRQPYINFLSLACPAGAASYPPNISVSMVVE